MKKFIAVFDGFKYSESTQKYALQLAGKCDAHLIGVFLNDRSYTWYESLKLVFGHAGLVSSAKRKLDKKDAKARAVAVETFVTACEKAGIDYSVHRDHDPALPALLSESTYADLLIINGTENMKPVSGKSPTRFIRHLLAQVQCPVLVVPAEYRPINKKVILYDGGHASLYAIKMSSYTLPSLDVYPTEVITVLTESQTLKTPDTTLLKEFMTTHFPETDYTVLEGKAETQILHNLKSQNEASLIVLGAYQRGRWRRPTMADTLMRNLNIPLFIAHNT